MKQEIVQPKKGFFLIHMIVYLALLTLITLYLMQWAAEASIQRSLLARKSDNGVMLAAVSDVWVRDMREAQEVISCSPTSCIIRYPTHDVGWHVSAHNELLRTEGRYYQGQWIEPSKSLMAQGVTQVSFTINHAMRLAHLALTKQFLHEKPMICSCTRTVWLCNGLVA